MNHASETALYDVAVIGGGIVGLATARALLQGRTRRLILLEAEDRLAAHQTGNNSGVIHSGLYYKPGSLKATLCAQGRERLYRFCAEHGVPVERCGKLVVAVDPTELPALENLERRGRENGLVGIERLPAERISDHEPHVHGVGALRIQETGIVDYVAFSETLGRLLTEAGAEIVLGARLLSVESDGDGLALETTKGVFRARNLVNCAGLHSDLVARACGVDPGLQIIPFRGEYYKLAAHRCHLVRHLVYPVPDPRFPFLGVHFTRMIHGGVEAGPNAVLAFKREGYTRFSFSPTDTLRFGLYPGFWRMASRFWKTGLGEMVRSFSKTAFLTALQRLLPELVLEDLEPGGAGVRAQALGRDGALIDDFHIVEAPRMVHVLNAPSPAATASLAIGDAIAERASRCFGYHA